MAIQFVMSCVQAIILLFIILFIIGCGKSPVGPLPPVIHAETFEDHIEMMQTPGHVVKWLEQFARYSDPYTGWNYPKDKDLAWSLARDFWENYIDGFSRGKCASFAAMMVACIREHGYECGIITYYWFTKEELIFGHSEAWLKEDSGKYSTLSNNLYRKEQFNSFEELKSQYIKYHVHEDGYIIFYDEYWKNGKGYTHENTI